jgi:hypothetical protein
MPQFLASLESSYYNKMSCFDEIVFITKGITYKIRRHYNKIKLEIIYKSNENQAKEAGEEKRSTSALI